MDGGTGRVGRCDRELGGAAGDHRPRPARPAALAHRHALGRMPVGTEELRVVEDRLPDLRCHRRHRLGYFGIEIVAVGGVALAVEHRLVVWISHLHQRRPAAAGRGRPLLGDLGGQAGKVRRAVVVGAGQGLDHLENRRALVDVEIHDLRAVEHQRHGRRHGRVVVVGAHQRAFRRRLPVGPDPVGQRRRGAARRAQGGQGAAMRRQPRRGGRLDVQAGHDVLAAVRVRAGDPHRL